MLKKYAQNPILQPKPEIPYEGIGVLNPGVIYDSGKFSMLYRAGGEGPDFKICLGLAESYDGLNFERVSGVNPVLFPKAGTYDGGCIEDARIIKLDGWFYVTYACRPYAPGPYWEPNGLKGAPDDAPDEFKRNKTISALARTKDFVNFERIGKMVGGDIDDRDVILFPEKIKGRYVMLRRPDEWCGPGFENEKPGIWLSFSDNMLDWQNDILLAKSEFDWESKKIGGGTPPIKTDLGWFVIYHGVDGNHIYRAGMMLLDLENPEKIIARCPQPILEPETKFERHGVFPNVVFPTGNCLVDGIIYVYYGGADKVCCVATADFQQLLDQLIQFNQKGKK